MPNNIPNFEAGKVVKLTQAISIVLGLLVTINPVGHAEPVSGAVIPANGPASGCIVAAYLDGLGSKPLVDVVLVTGDSNNGRRITLPAEHFAS